MPSSKNGPVLVVDDDVDIREAIRDTLAEEGYQTAEARDGSAALRYLASHPPPPLILLDWNMAPMNGRQFMDELVKTPGLAGIPVVLLTADVRVSEAVGKEFVGYLKKPVELEALFAIVKLHVN